MYRYGSQKCVLSDRGQSFLANFSQKLCEISGIQRINASSYKPSTNSLAEMQCKRVINHVRAFRKDKKDYPQLLQAIAATIRNSVVTSLGCSPLMVLYGVLPRMSFEWDFHPDKECPSKQLEIALRYAETLLIMRKILQQKMCKTAMKQLKENITKQRDLNNLLKIYVFIKKWTISNQVHRPKILHFTQDHFKFWKLKLGC
jgi:hypothetical protein